jgi:hypothetical protein
VITRATPGGDDVVAAWLAERFLFAGRPAEVLFVPPERAPGAYRSGDCLVGVGYTHDAANLFFDRRAPACAGGRETCATRQV